MRSALLLVALQIVTLKAPPDRIPTVWLIGFDRTASLANAAFQKLPEWNREVILPLVEPGDTVSLMFVDHEPRKPMPDPITRVLDKRSRQFVRQVLEFDGLIRAQKQASRLSQTDLGVLLRDLRCSIEVDGAAKVKQTYVLIALTDAKPDGPQTVANATRPLPDDIDYRIVVLGAVEGTELGLREMASHAGFADSARMLVVPRALVDQSTTSIQRFLGRRVNPIVLQDLRRGREQPPAKR